MQQAGPQPDPEKTMKLVWIALLVSPLAYAGVLASGFVPMGEGDSPPAIPIALAVFAVGVAASAHFFWRKASGAGLPLHAERPPLGSVFTHYLLAWVLDESIAIYGFVVGLLGFGASVWAWFIAAGLALLLLHRPAAD